MKIDAQQIAEHHSSARTAMQRGNYREAHQHCLNILKLDSSHADAWFLCGVIAGKNGQSVKAVEIFRNAIKLAPEQAEYRAELGKQLLALRQPEQALVMAQQALALAPSDVPTLNTLGTIFSHLGEHEKALSCFDGAASALQAKPGRAAGLSDEWRANLYFNMAASLQFSGDFDAAEQAYEQAIDLYPRFYKAHSALSQLRQQTAGDNHLSRLHQLRDGAETARDRLHLGHAIAKEQEDIGQYKDALASLAWAKQAQARQVSYDAATDAELFTGIRRLFTTELFSSERASHSGCDNPEPIFIVGMPRTGTTLVEQILSSHSQVFAAGELQNFSLQVKRMTDSAGSETLDIVGMERALQLDMSRLGGAYIDSTRPRTGHTPRFIDKLPLNFLYLGLIRLALPGATLICLRRDPMDTCLSNYRQLFATNFKPYHYNLDLLNCGRYYIEFDRLMQHWHQVMPGAIFELQYEALVERPEQVSRELLAHCRLPWEEQCLAFHQRKTSVATASAVQVRSDIYRSSVNRWQRYGEAMQPLYDLLQGAGLYRS